MLYALPDWKVEIIALTAILIQRILQWRKFNFLKTSQRSGTPDLLSYYYSKQYYFMQELIFLHSFQKEDVTWEKYFLLTTYNAIFLLLMFT